MKNLIIILWITVFFCSCGENKSASSSESGEDESVSMAGIFVYNGDTLKITKDEESYSNEIEFDIVAQNEEQWITVFNTADHFESMDDQVKYQFQDSSEYSIEDLVFSYSYTNDNWTIEDLVSENNRDTSRLINLSGLYVRVE